MSSPAPTRRPAVKLPSRRKHVLIAASALLAGLFLPVLLMSLFGKTADSRADGRLAITPLPAAEPIAPLNDESLASPDLLAGDVPDGVNPTDILAAETSSVDAAAPATDALGNPITTQSSPRPKQIDISPRTSQALVPAPITGLTRQSAFGPVPKRGSRTALKAYRRPFRAQSGKRPVSIIIGGLGVNRHLTEEAITSLPADVTLSFAAHSVGLQDWINKARQDGHEVFIEIPMESESFDPNEPGSDRALRINAQANENARNFDWMLSRAQGYAGVINFNGDLFLKRTDVAAVFMEQVSATGLGFLTDGSFETPSLTALSRTVGQPFKTGHGLIDPDPIPQVISARLSGLSNTATTELHPVGVGFGYPETLAEVQNWIATLEGKGLQLAPATAALK